MSNISIILHKPKNQGNMGAIARVMQNFDISSLYLIDPQTDHLGREALDRSTHSKSILKKAKLIKLYDLKKFDFVIATTSKLGNDYNVPRSPLTPDILATLIKDKKNKIGLLFGPEDYGLSNEQVKLCDFVVSIPTSKKSPTMNLSHAVTIILYEIFKSSKNPKIGKVKAADTKSKHKLLDLIDTKLDTLEFSTKEKKETQRIIWKRLIGKSFLTEREIHALFGFFKKI